MTTLFAAIALLFVGLLILFVLGRRRFMRRGTAGLERFSSYGMAVVVRLLEAVLKLGGLLAILLGIALCLLHWYNS